MHINILLFVVEKWLYKTWIWIQKVYVDLVGIWICPCRQVILLLWKISYTFCTFSYLKSRLTFGVGLTLSFKYLIRDQLPKVSPSNMTVSDLTYLSSSRHEFPNIKLEIHWSSINWWGDTDILPHSLGPCTWLCPTPSLDLLISSTIPCCPNPMEMVNRTKDVLLPSRFQKPTMVK